MGDVLYCRAEEGGGLILRTFPRKYVVYAHLEYKPHSEMFAVQPKVCVFFFYRLPTKLQVSRDCSTETEPADYK